MIDYLLQNHIYFFLYLSPIEINQFSRLNKKFINYFTNDIWYLVLVKQSQFPKNIRYYSSINFIRNPNYVTSIDNMIKTKNKPLYQYLALEKGLY